MHTVGFDRVVRPPSISTKNSNGSLSNRSGGLLLPVGSPGRGAMVSSLAAQ